MATTKFLEPGTDATQDFSFWGATTGTVSSSATFARTGPRSIKCDSAGGGAAFPTTPGGVISDTGARISFGFLFPSLGSGGNAGGPLNVTQAGGSRVVAVNLQNAGTLTLSPQGATAVNGTTVLSANTWYRICLSYYITNATTFQFKLYINGILECTANAGTLTNITSNKVAFRSGSSTNTSPIAYFDDIYIDDGASSSSQPDTGDIRVTAKRPFANGTTNGFTTQIGAGGSGYGTGHAPQVNEQPLNVADGWSMIGAGSAITEEYNIENQATGDVDIINLLIIDYIGWVYAKSLAGETGKIILNNVSSNISLVNANTMFTVAAGSTTFPTGTGKDIGIITDTSLTTVSLFECGVVVAFRYRRKSIGGGVTYSGAYQAY